MEVLQQQLILLFCCYLSYCIAVVALFNAIAKTKKEAAEKEAAEKSKDKPEGNNFSEIFISYVLVDKLCLCPSSKFVTEGLLRNLIFLKMGFFSNLVHILF